LPVLPGNRSRVTSIPLFLAVEPVEGHPAAALVLTRDRPAASGRVTGFALLRHAAAAAVAQSGGCQCCRAPSGLSMVLRQLFLDRIHGTASFETVVVAAGDEAPIVEAMSDPLVAARYEYKGRIEAGAPPDV
jgi:hypothetical protein